MVPFGRCGGTSPGHIPTINIDQGITHDLEKEHVASHYIDHTANQYTPV